MRAPVAKPVEGDVVVLSDRSIWMVKGCVHPPEGVVAMPRFAEGRRLKRAEDSFNLVRRAYRHYLRFVEEIGCEVPVLPWGAVKRYVSARDLTLKMLRRPGDAGPLALVEGLGLVNLLRNSCGLTCWLTGSLLGLYPSSGRVPDIDVLCLDRCGALDCLRRLRSEGVLGPVNPAEFISEAFAVSEVLQPCTIARLAALRLTQGVFNGFKYTLRLINCGRIAGALGPYAITTHVDCAAVVLRSSDYRFPAVYEAEILRPCVGTRKALLLTHRVRLTELPAGSVILGSASLHMRSANEGYWIVNFDLPPSRVDAVLTGTPA